MLRLDVAVVQTALISRAELVVENIALRQQLAVLKARRPRPPLRNRDRLFWIALRRIWSRWADVLIIVKPETVIRWHRAGFRAYWRRKSTAGRGGRKPVAAEIRDLIRKLATENVTWGAPRIRTLDRIRVRRSLRRAAGLDRDPRATDEARATLHVRRCARELNDARCATIFRARTP